MHTWCRITFCCTFLVYLHAVCIHFINDHSYYSISLYLYFDLCCYVPYLVMRINKLLQDLFFLSIICHSGVPEGLSVLTLTLLLSMLVFIPHAYMCISLPVRLHNSLLLSTISQCCLHSATNTRTKDFLLMNKEVAVKRLSYDLCKGEKYPLSSERGFKLIGC